MHQVEQLPRVLILATGGTIAGRGVSALNTSDYKAGLVPVEELADAVPGIDSIALVEMEQVMNVPSSSITMTDMLGLVRRIDQAFRDDAALAGVVVTHGTDTMEESAFFAHLLLPHRRPVVFVGSMRPSTAISADGPMNLANAVRVAATPSSVDKGVLIVMNDEIYSARDVTKTNTARLHTFRSNDLGPLGFIDDAEVSYYHAPLKRHTHRSEFCPDAICELPRVDIIYSYTGADRALVEAIVSTGAKGIVLAGSGSGSIHPDAGEELRLLRQRGVTVVRSSRVGGGRILTRHNPELHDLPADNLNPQKARILLILALTKTDDLQQLRRIFTEY